MTDKPDVEVLNYLGVKHNTYRSNMYALALKNPSEYYKLRGEVEEYVINSALESWFSTFFWVMSKGTKPPSGMSSTGDSIVTGANAIKTFVPNLPKKDIEDFSLSASETLRQLCMDCVRRILPDNYNTIMSKKFAEIGALGGSGSDDST